MIIKRYEKIIKRKIRESKLFKKNNIVNIIGIESNTLKFFLEIINKINNKFNLNLQINIEVYKNLEDININNKERIVLVIPIEGIFFYFLLYFLEKKQNLPINEKSNKYFNITYYVSEYHLSKSLNKIPKLNTNKKEILDFIYSIISRNEKYSSSLARSINYLIKFFR